MAQAIYRPFMSAMLPTRRSNAELAEEALARARMYRAKARADAQRAAGAFGLWVQELAAKGDAGAIALCERWNGRTASGRGGAAKKAPRGSAPIQAARAWPVEGLELVSGQVRELVRQGRRLEARGLIVKAEESTGMVLVPAAHRSKWGLGGRPGEVVGPLS